MLKETLKFLKAQASMSSFYEIGPILLVEESLKKLEPGTKLSQTQTDQLGAVIAHRTTEHRIYRSLDEQTKSIAETIGHQMADGFPKGCSLLYLSGLKPALEITHAGARVLTDLYVGRDYQRAKRVEGFIKRINDLED